MSLILRSMVKLTIPQEKPINFLEQAKPTEDQTKVAESPLPSPEQTPKQE